MDTKVIVVLSLVVVGVLAFISQSAVADSCRNLDFAPNNFITIDETAKPGTQIFSISVENQESWSYVLERSDKIDGSLWRELQTYFNFKKFGDKYEMIVDKTPDLEYFYNKYSINLKTLVFAMTCSSRQVPDQTTELVLLIRPVNEFAPEFIGLPFVKKVKENTPIGTSIFDMENVTIDKDVNPSTKEISLFHLLKYRGNSPDGKTSQLDSLAYFAMPDLQKGVITVKENLDYEALSAIGSTKFVLNVSAADIHGDISYTTIEIDVVDVDDLPPEFRHPSCPLHIARSRPCPVSFQARVPVDYKGPLLHMIPGPIQARDMDAIGDSIFLTLVEGPGELEEMADKFVIDNSTGIVTLLEPFSKPMEVDLVVVAREVSLLGRTTQAPLKVYIVKDQGGSFTTDFDKVPNNTEPTTTNSNHGTNPVVGGGGDHVGGGGDRDGTAVHGGDTSSVTEGSHTNSDRGNSSSGIDNTTIFLIIIGILSALVLFLAILSTCILCSIKKEQRNKVDPSVTLNNFPFSDRPSSYHHSLDGTSNDITHDEFDMMGERIPYHSSKSYSPLPNKSHRELGDDIPLRSTLSGFEFKKYEPWKNHSYHNNHFNGKLRSRSDNDNQKTKYGQRTTQESEKGERESNLIYQENICCTPLNISKLCEKRMIGRSVTSNGQHLNKKINIGRSSDSVRSKSSSLQQMSRPSTARSSSDQQTNTSDIHNAYYSNSPSKSQITHSSSTSTNQRHSTDRLNCHSEKRVKTASTKILHSEKARVDVGRGVSSGRKRENAGGENRLEANLERQEYNSKEGPKTTVRERRIRIPSGTLIMKQSVNSTPTNGSRHLNESSDNDGDNDDDEDDVETDAVMDNNGLATDDGSSSCFDSFSPDSTPAPGFHKSRVLFQTEPSQTDVLSVMPLDLSSCPNSDYFLGKARIGGLLDSRQTDEHPPNKTQHVNNLHVPDIYTIPISEVDRSVTNDRDATDGQDKLFEKVSPRGVTRASGRSDDNAQHVKPRRLPGLNISGRKGITQVDPKANTVIEERSQSESKLFEQRLVDLKEASKSEPPYRDSDNVFSTTSTNSTTTAASSAVRKKKKKRRAMSQRHSMEDNSGVVNFDIEQKTI